MLGKFISVLLTRLYIAVVCMWIIFFIVGWLQDSPFPVQGMCVIAYWTLGIIVIGLIHWFVLYRKESNDDAR